MKSPRQLTIVCGLAAAGLAWGVPHLRAQSKSGDAAALREAIRFERAKDAADRRQLAKEAKHPSVVEPGASGEANRTSTPPKADQAKRESKK